MHIKESDELLQLARRVRAGDGASAAKLRELLEPHMTRMVRRVFAGQSLNSGLAAWIFSESKLLETDLPSMTELERDALAARVARELCTAIVARMQNAPTGSAAARDTIPN